MAKLTSDDFVGFWYAILIALFSLLLVILLAIYIPKLLLIILGFFIFLVGVPNIAWQIYKRVNKGE